MDSEGCRDLELISLSETKELPYDEDLREAVGNSLKKISKSRRAVTGRSSLGTSVREFRVGGIRCLQFQQ